MVKLFCDLQWYKTTFTKNSARFYGGGIYLNSSDIKFSACTTFMRNSVSLNGGGIFDRTTVM